MVNNKKVKLNMGSASKRVGKEFLNVDVRRDQDVDIILDLTAIPYEQNFAVADEWMLDDVPKDDWSNWADEIFAEEILEHISHRDIFNVVREWFRIIKPGGKLTIQVPDIGKMCEYYANGQVCPCIPHKSKTKGWDGFKADELCNKCHGKAKINPVRWEYAFSGAGKHRYDFHKSHFTINKMRDLLERVGFKKIAFKDNIYKICVSCEKEVKI